MTTEDGAKGAGARRPVDAKTRARIVREARKGELSRNALAKKFGVSPSTVSRFCAEAKPPVTFDRSHTEVAVKAHQLDLKAERSRISEKAVAEVHRLFGLLVSSHEVLHWDKEGDLHRATIDRPTSGDVKNYATSIGILVDKHLVLVKHDTDDMELSLVDSWNAHIMGAPIETPEGWE